MLLQSNSALCERQTFPISLDGSYDSVIAVWQLPVDRIMVTGALCQMNQFIYIGSND